MRIGDLIAGAKRLLKKVPPIGKAVDKRNKRISDELVASYHRDGPRVAYEVCRAMEEVGIEVWLCAGSLLGAVRDGDFIPWDNDLDLCIVAERDFDWDFLEQTMADAGYEKIREFTCDGRVTEQSFSFGASHFDIFAMEPLGHGKARVCIYMNIPGQRYKSRKELSVMFLDTYVPFGKRLVDIRGWELPVPENAEALLDKQYGTSWRIPDPEYKDGTTYRLLEGAIGMKSFFLR